MLEGKQAVAQPIRLRLREHLRQLEQRTDDRREQGPEQRQRRVRAVDFESVHRDRLEHRRGEIRREKRPERCDEAEARERECEVALREIERACTDDRAPDVIDEHPDSRQHERAGDREPGERAREQRRAESDQSGGHEPQLGDRQPPRVDRHAGPDGDELGHRAYDRHRDPAHEQGVEACQPARPGSVATARTVPPPMPTARKPSASRKCRNGITIGGCWSVRNPPGIPFMSPGTARTAVPFLPNKFGR